MALISAKTIITSLSLFHLTLAFFFLTSPATVNEQALVWVLGQSMGMPESRSFDVASPPLGFLAVLLAFIGITDLVSLSMPEEICLVYHWGMQAPVRVSVSFALLVYLFLATGSSPVYSSRSYGRIPPYGPNVSGGDALKNRVFFAFVFVEMISWFWAWVTLREERGEIVMRALRRRRESNNFEE